MANDETAAGRIRLTVDAARALGEAAMRGAGCDAEDAWALTDHVLDAALCGYEYSGLPKLLNVVDDPLFRQPRRTVSVVKETGPTALLDGHNTTGMVAAWHATRATIERAERRGIAAEIVRASICLGTARVAMGDQTGAGEPLRHAYQQAQGLEKCSKEHFNALVTYGHYLAQMMDLPAAERVLRQAVEVSNEVKGRDSLYYATAIATISPLLRLMGQLPEADALLSVAADITSKKLGRRNPAYSRIIAQQALNRSIQMRHVEAETLVNEALGIDRDTLGENHPIYASTLAIQSQILLNQQKLHEAETGFRRAEALMIERVGPNHAEVGSIRLALGHALAMSRRFGEALPYLEAGEQTLRSAFGPAHPQARQAAMVLQQVRAACGFQNIGGAIHRFFTGK